MAAYFKIVSANIGTSMLSLADMLKTDKPEILFLQEVTSPTSDLLARVTGLGYSAECNIDRLHPTRPGTAIVWRQTLKVSEVNCLIERRAQSIRVGGETYINVYAPSGSNNKRERAEFFTELFPHLLHIGGGKLPVLVGDFNAVLSAADTTRNFAAKYCQVLDGLVTQMRYKDCFRQLYPAGTEYTFHRGALVAQSRLDRVYAPPHLSDKILSVCHKAGTSDHCRVETVFNITAGQSRASSKHSRTYWKLNTSLLDSKDFLDQFKVLYGRLSSLIEEYDDHGQWWEEMAKPSVAKFCKDFSYKLAKERRDTKQFFYASLNIFLREENWSEVARVKEQLKKMLAYDSMGLVIRSRQKEYVEEERGSLFHHNKEMKKTGSNNIKKMKFRDENGQVQVTEDSDVIADHAVSFYDALFNGRHDKNLIDTGHPFLPSEEYLMKFLSPLSTLSEESQVRLVRDLTYEEVKQLVKECPTGRSPGLDGLPYEFYKATWDVIGQDFTEVLKAQLTNFTLIESGRHGATALPSKVTGVPFVTDLRPLTLLCCDYRILSKAVNGRLHPVMGEVVHSSQLATGQKEKNILTGVYDIIATVDYVNKHDKPAYIASYDQVKAYDRASIQFLILVMERMAFPEVFRRWVKMLHKDATTCLILPSGLSRVIPVTFSFRQGDPVSLDLYALQQEPFLRVLRNKLHGIAITNFRQLDEDYCDDTEFVSEDVKDLIIFDQIMTKFESTSGAILSRNRKSKIMGLGPWQGKETWPREVNWLKTEQQLRIFGFTICPNYQQTVEMTWKNVIRGFEKVFYSWSSRSLDTLCQRVEVAKVFAMSKLYYVAQVLPLPNKYRKRIEQKLSSFIFQGRHERLSLSVLENTNKQGGLGLPNIAVKADCLLLKQMTRIMIKPDETSYRHLGYWLGAHLVNTECGEDFPELAELGPVSHQLQRKSPLHGQMLHLFEEALMRREVEKSNLTAVKTKLVYLSRMEDQATPPNVESKYPHIDFSDLVYPRLTHPVLEAKQKDIIFTLVHGIYKNRARLHDQGRADDPLCPHPACREDDLAQDIEHIFCSCHLVREAWLWVRRKVIRLLSRLGPPPIVSCEELILVMFPRCTEETEVMFLLGNYIELVDKNAVNKQKVLRVDSMKGVLEAKMEFVKVRAVPQLCVNLQL